MGKIMIESMTWALALSIILFTAWVANNSPYKKSCVHYWNKLNNNLYPTVDTDNFLKICKGRDNVDPAFTYNEFILFFNKKGEL